MALVYGLVASDAPSDIRYVGQTKRGAERRLRRHVEASHSARGPIFPVNQWIRSVEERGAAVQVVTLVGDASWHVDEIMQIRAQRTMGAQLLNCTDGGDGHLNPTAETRAKLSAARLGKRKTAEHCAKISASLKRLLQDPAAREALRLRHVGRKRSAATRARLSGENNAMAKLSASTVRRMRARFAAGEKLPVIAASEGCSYPACYAAVKGLTWRSL